MRSRLAPRLLQLSCAAALAVGLAGPAKAVVVTDPAGDFLSGFGGTPRPELDVLSLSATFDGASFHVAATMAGDITQASSLYVFGFNRGLGNRNFASVGLPNVRFDSVITLTGANVVTGTDLSTTPPTPINTATIAHTISGATVTLDIPVGLLPSLGRDPSNYGINLWPRQSGVAGNAALADFAPDAIDVPVPEPASTALLLLGLVGVGMSRLRVRTPL